MLKVPDILVVGPDGYRVALAVLVRVEHLVGSALDAAEAQLMEFMAGMACPVGLLVDDGMLRIYRDEYRVEGAASIVRIGEYTTVGLPFTTREGGSFTEERFAYAVQSWLESLRGEEVRRRLPSELRGPIESLVAPALDEGEVRAGVPRWQHTGS